MCHVQARAERSTQTCSRVTKLFLSERNTENAKNILGKFIIFFSSVELKFHWITPQWHRNICWVWMKCHGERKVSQEREKFENSIINIQFCWILFEFDNFSLFSQPLKQPTRQHWSVIETMVRCDNENKSEKEEELKCCYVRANKKVLSRIMTQKHFC